MLTQQNNSWFELSRNLDAIGKILENHSVDKVKKLWCYRRLIKITLLYFLSLCVFPNLRYPSNYFEQIYRAHVTHRHNFEIQNVSLVWERKTTTTTTITTTKTKADITILLILRAKRSRTSNNLLIVCKKCSQRQNSLSASIRLNFLRLQMQNI